MSSTYTFDELMGYIKHTDMREVLEIIYNLLIDEKEYYSVVEYQQLLRTMNERRSEILEPLVYIEHAQSFRNIIEDTTVIFGLKSVQRDARYFVSAILDTDFYFELIKDALGDFHATVDADSFPEPIKKTYSLILHEYKKWVEKVVENCSK